MQNQIELNFTTQCLEHFSCLFGTFFKAGVHARSINHGFFQKAYNSLVYLITGRCPGSTLSMFSYRGATEGLKP